MPAPQTPPSGPGLVITDEARAWVASHQLAPNDPALVGRTLKTDDEKRATRNSQQAGLMRRRRKDPKIKAQDAKTAKARNTAYRRLAKAFPVDFYRIYNAERVQMGLPAVSPGVRKPTTTTIKGPKPVAVIKEVQAPPRPDVEVVDTKRIPVKDCRHNQGLKKLMYGTFCEACGSRIR